VTDENKELQARAELEAADDALRAAQALVGLGLVRDAASRAYYAAFHAARALLFRRGLQAKTHGGMLRLFSQHVVAGGDLAPRYNGILTRLQALRGSSDYALAFTMSSDDVAAEVALAGELVGEAHRLVLTRAS